MYTKLVYWSALNKEEFRDFLTNASLFGQILFETAAILVKISVVFICTTENEAHVFDLALNQR